MVGRLGCRDAALAVLTQQANQFVGQPITNDIVDPTRALIGEEPILMSLAHESVLAKVIKHIEVRRQLKISGPTPTLSN